MNTKKEALIPKKKKIDRPIILTGNGSHLAHGKVRGIVEKTEENSNYINLKLTNGDTFKAFFHPQLSKVYKRSPELFVGEKNYLCYPRLNDDGTIKVLSLALLLQQEIHQEEWVFIGEWHKPSHRLRIQRSLLKVKQKNLKIYSFYLSDWEKFDSYLWNGFCYKCLCDRHNQRLSINSSYPFACPLKKIKQ